MPNVAITPDMGDTSYLCVDFELPVDKRFHAIRFDPIIASESAPVVHHVRSLGFMCPLIAVAVGALHNPEALQSFGCV